MGDEPLAEAFWAVARRLRHVTKETVAPLGVTPGQSRAIRELSQHGTMRLSELSEHLHIAPRSTTEVVDGLQDRGLVERRPDPDDRRATLVALTPEGLTMAEAIRAARREEAEKFFGGLPGEDRAELTRILGQLLN